MGGGAKANRPPPPQDYTFGEISKMARERIATAFKPLPVRRKVFFSLRTQCKPSYPPLFLGSYKEICTAVNPFCLMLPLDIKLLHLRFVSQP